MGAGIRCPNNHRTEYPDLLRLYKPPHAPPRYIEPDSDDICRRYHGGADTSVEAHDRHSEAAWANIRAAMYERVREQTYRPTGLPLGARGATTDEVEEVLELPNQTASARMSELLRSGVVQVLLNAAGEQIKRPTRRGRPARVVVAVSDVSYAEALRAVEPV